MTPLIALLLATAGVITPTSAAYADEWPVEYVRRPQTIPAGWVRASLSTYGFIPDRDYRTSAGQRYADSLRFGAALAVGATPRIEGDIVLPGLACFSDREIDPDPCAGADRLTGAGIGLSVGAVRTSRLQLSLSSGVFIATPQPTTFEVRASVSGKWLAADRLAIELGLNGSKWLDPPPGFPEGVFDTATVDLGLNVQVTRHLLAFTDVSPWVSFDQPGHPNLELLAGASWTFENGIQIILRGGDFNVLPRRTADLRVPGRFISSSVGFWL